MGKQSRRKARSKNKQAVACEDSSSSTLLQRLRHADSRTRHAGLTALAHGKRIPPNLLQAIRERVMDDDLDCAQVAAECLANHLSFGTSSHRYHDMTASWTVVLLERSQQAQRQLQQEEQSADQQAKQWWALVSQCLRALYSLVETNPQALERLNNNAAVDIIVNLLDLGSNQLRKATADADLNRYIEDAVVNAARTLHSSLDDNLPLLSKFTPAHWTILQTCCMLPVPVARLHCAGSLVTARFLSPHEATSLQTALVTHVIPLLVETLEWDTERASHLCTSLQQARAKLSEEEADDALERNVIQKVNEKREPARMIARRQKALREQQQTRQKSCDNDDDMVAEDQHDEHAMRQDAMQQDAPENSREVFETTRIAWWDFVVPLELALEITANLTSLAPEQEDHHEDMEMEDAVALSPMDEALLQEIARARLPHRLAELLSVLCCIPEHDSLVDVQQSMQELQSKCAACLGNCVSEHFAQWVAADIFWQQIKSALEASNGNPAIANTMAAALRSLADLRKQCQPQDLDLLLKLGSSSSSCQKEAVEMLGILCSMEEHPEDVNRKVCSTLLAITPKRAAVMNEVLNALMDIYGDDECHPSVFNILGVLSYFQQATPSFKKMIQCDRDDAPEEEVEQWRETALNASRFSSYKKGQL